MGYQRFGNEKVWNGHTGRPLTNKIFVGPVYFPPHLCLCSFAAILLRIVAMLICVCFLEGFSKCWAEGPKAKNSSASTEALHSFGASEILSLFGEEVLPAPEAHGE